MAILPHFETFALEPSTHLSDICVLMVTGRSGLSLRSVSQKLFCARVQFLILLNVYIM